MLYPLASRLADGGDHDREDDRGAAAERSIMDVPRDATFPGRVWSARILMGDIRLRVSSFRARPPTGAPSETDL